MTRWMSFAGGMFFAIGVIGAGAMAFVNQPVPVPPASERAISAIIYTLIAVVGFVVGTIERKVSPTSPRADDQAASADQAGQ